MSLLLTQDAGRAGLVTSQIFCTLFSPDDLAVGLLNDSSSKIGRPVSLFLIRFWHSNIFVPGRPVLKLDVWFLSLSSNSFFCWQKFLPTHLILSSNFCRANHQVTFLNSGIRARRRFDLSGVCYIPPSTQMSSETPRLLSRLRRTVEFRESCTGHYYCFFFPFI
ncbi:hypothetical protein M9H77_22826 [Catharanthus roseus]|uniref:Uncharacterized protein n=1 Tax=Catharanthus roseus TaxID=4058 RepID=A0ACC0AVM6_CATRO|nr:hypothetical protein M9H77_22826 [Catharanthus roseus]